MCGHFRIDMSNRLLLTLMMSVLMMTTSLAGCLDDNTIESPTDDDCDPIYEMDESYFLSDCYMIPDDRTPVWVGEHYYLAYNGNDTTTLNQYQVIDLSYHVSHNMWGSELPENETYIVPTTYIEITWDEWPGKEDNVSAPPHFGWWSPAFLNATNGTLGDFEIMLPEHQGQDALGEEHLTMNMSLSNFTEGWYEGEITWWAYDLNETMDFGLGEMPIAYEIKDRDFELNLPIA